MDIKTYLIILFLVLCISANIKCSLDEEFQNKPAIMQSSKRVLIRVRRKGARGGGGRGGGGRGSKGGGSSRSSKKC